MKRSTDMKTTTKLVLLAGVLGLASGPAPAADYYLAAKAFAKALPDGTTVPMWGYVLDPGGACWGTTTAVDRVTCVNNLPDPVLTEPRLVVPSNETELRIGLTNALPEPTSIVIPGQELPYSDADNGPTWNDGSTGPRGADLTKRVRSFGREANPDGGRMLYIWNGVRSNPIDRSGTFPYHSGTYPQMQVYMGLYGAVTKNAVEADTVGGTPAEIYPGITYDNEVVLFYSDIDPLFNEAVADDNLTTAIDYQARWFLVNGEPYSTACTDLDTDTFDDASGYPCANMAQTLDIPAGQAKTRTLVRFISAASETHVPTLQGLYVTIHGEDGLQYNWQDGATVMDTAPREQYSVMLPPLKTKDAIIEAQLEGRYAVYDGNGYMTNPTDPDDVDHGDPLGGMLRFLSVGADGNLPPVVADDVAEVVDGRTIAIDVLANDSDPEGQPLTIAGFTAATAGTVVCDTVSPGGVCTYTADGGLGDSTFTYSASDGVNTNDPPDATVTVTVVVNDPPLAVDDAETTPVNTAVVIDVLANDSDPNGDALAVVGTTNPTNGTVAINPDNTVTYTPNASFTGPDSFDYTIEDIDGLSATATVDVTVEATPGNTPPVAVDDAYDTVESGVLNVAAPGVLGNDTDADTDPLTVSAVEGSAANVGSATPTANGSVNMAADGSFSYQPSPDFVGDDSFTYVANDGVDDSNTATVTISVAPQNDVPVANDDVFILKSMYAPGQLTTVPAPGVLANDTDPDVGDTLTAVLDPDPAVDPPAEVALSPDGSFTYTTGNIDNLTLGTVDTFTYVANDGIADSDPATVTLSRELVVSQAVCERRPNGRCDWRIEGTKLNTANVRVEAWVGGFDVGQLIGRVRTGDPAWVIERNFSPVNLDLQPIDVRILRDEDAQIFGYPVTEQ